MAADAQERIVSLIGVMEPFVSVPSSVLPSLCPPLSSDLSSCVPYTVPAGFTPS